MYPHPRNTQIFKGVKISIMGSFDDLFPDPIDCYFVLFQDAVNIIGKRNIPLKTVHLFVEIGLIF
jgi:hypothetical protein